MLSTRVTHSTEKAIDLESGLAEMELSGVAADGVSVTLHPMS